MFLCNNKIKEILSFPSIVNRNSKIVNNLYLCRPMDETKIISLLPKFDTTFFERYAKIVLVDLLGEKYANLVNRDRPDLQDNEAGIGIEVTRAMVTGRDDAISLITDMAGADDISDSDIERIRRYGYSYGIHRRLMGKVEEEFWSLAIPLRRIIESKVGKVANGFYGCFRKWILRLFPRIRFVCILEG